MILVPLDDIGKAVTQRQMAGGVLVKQRVVEQHPGLIDRAFKGHQRALTEVRRTLVHADHLPQQGLVLLRVNLHRLAVLKADPEVFDQLAVVGKRLGRVDNAVRHALLRRGKHLLGGHIRVVEKPFFTQQLLRAPHKERVVQQSDPEIGAVRGPVLQSGQPQAVEIVTTGVEIVVVRLPCGNRIVVLLHTDGVKDFLPQHFHRLSAADSGEHLFCPRRTRNSGNAPLVPVFHLIAEGLDDLIARLRGLCALGLIDPLQTVRIIGFQINTDRERFHLVLQLFDLPILHLRQRGHRAGLQIELGQRLIRPVHNNLPGAAPIALLCNQASEFRLFDRSQNDDILPLLNLAALGSDQTRVFSENRFFHTHSSAGDPGNLSVK